MASILWADPDLTFGVVYREPKFLWERFGWEGKGNEGSMNGGSLKRAKHLQNIQPYIFFGIKTSRVL